MNIATIEEKHTSGAKSFSHEEVGRLLEEIDLHLRQLSTKTSAIAALNIKLERLKGERGWRALWKKWAAW